MKNFLKEVEYAKFFGLSLYYNHSFSRWFAARTGLVSTGIELIHTFKKHERFYPNV